MYIETVIEDFMEGREHYNNRIMVYADDIAEWSTSQEKNEDLTRWDECFLRSMKTNVENTAILTVSRTQEEDFNITIGNKMVKNINAWKCCY